MGVLESLRPPPKLETLEIVNYPGVAFPSWMGDAAFLLLSRLVLSNCKNCTQLPPLGQLPCLKSLSIHGLSGVKKVGEEFLHIGDDGVGTSIAAFPQLETLHFQSMDRWERWATANASILPPLSYLCIRACPKLEGVPPTFTTALQTLHISNCPALRSLQFLPPSIQRLEPAGDSTGKLADCAATLLPALKHLSIEADPELTADQLNPTLLHLTTLQSLVISSCQDLRTLPDGLTRLTNLQVLEIYNCTPELSEGCQVGGLLWPRIAHIPRIEIVCVRVQNNAVEYEFSDSLSS